MFSSVLRRALPPALLAAVALTATGPATAQPAAAPKPVSAVQHGLNSVARSCGHGCLQVTATGFARSEKVRVGELDRPGWARVVRADRSGQVCFRWAPARSRSDVLTFVGLGAPSTGGGSGNIELTVPRIAVYRWPVDLGASGRWSMAETVREPLVTDQQAVPVTQSQRLIVRR